MKQPDVLYIGTDFWYEKILDLRLGGLNIVRAYYADSALEAIAKERDLILFDPWLAAGKLSIDQVPGLREYLKTHNNNANLEIGKHVLGKIRQPPNSETPVMIILTLPDYLEPAKGFITVAKKLGFKSIYNFISTEGRDKLEADVRELLDYK